jgi:hypothetical protein
MKSESRVVGVRQNPVTPFLARWRIHGASLIEGDRGENGPLVRACQAGSRKTRRKQNRLFPLPPALRPDGGKCHRVLPRWTTEGSGALIRRAERDRPIQTVSQCRFRALRNPASGGCADEDRRRGSHGSPCDKPARRQGAHAHQIETARHCRRDHRLANPQQALCHTRRQTVSRWDPWRC